jgi:hypothetical protein
VPESLTEEQWQPIDGFIFGNNMLKAIQLIRDVNGASLHGALDMLVARFEKLRVERRGEFAADPERFWEGFYS